MIRRLIAIVTTSCLALTTVFAADEPKSDFEGLKYRSIGPAAGGRVARACGVPGDPLTYYVAAASGGVWKSEDGGVKFKPIFDDQSTTSIGSIAVAPSDTNVVYVGTGEANIRGNVAAGNGIYRSVDGGKTWKHVWKQIGQIGTIVVHPKNADIAYAAVLGHAFGPNAERGIYRTTDGGKNWKRVLSKNEDTGASDIAIDVNNPRVLFAGMWQARRKPWDLISGGPGSGLHVSRDGGDTWDQLGPTTADDKKGLPAGPWGKVCVAIAPSDSRRVYAMIEADQGGLFRSDDGGGSWKLVSGDRKLRQRAWYFSTITVDPTSENTVWCPQVRMHKSTDGGKTFTSIKGFNHVDHHDVWIDPKNPKRMIVANDGGIDISTDGGATWRSPPLPICQFYHVSVDNAHPYRVLGCMQDMGSCRGPSNSLCRDGIMLGEWHTIGGGEAGHAVADPTNPNIIYAGEYGGYISRYDHTTRQSRNISAYPFDPSGHGAEILKFRFQWTAPIMVSKHEPHHLYHAANVLFRSANGGQTWDKVSTDLTRNDRNKQKWAGGPITGDNTGVEIYGTIFALAESPINKKVLWVGSDDGLVHVSTDSAFTWKNVTPNVPDLPDWATILCIEPSSFDESTAYLVADAHRLDDYKPYVWVTRDMGETWTRLGEDLPRDGYARVVRHDPAKKGLLYLGTEKGIYVSHDDGKTWQTLRLNMPAVPVTDLVVKDGDLVVATQGRALWILDDLTPIREWSKQVGTKAAHLFTPRPATRWRQHGSVTAHQEIAAGQNPENGAVFTYRLKEDATKPAIFEVFNAKNERIARLEGKRKNEEDPPETEAPTEPRVEIPTGEGLNQFTWDLTHRGSKIIAGAQVDGGDPTSGPLVAPGTYTVKLTIDGRVLTGKIEVRMDPRVVNPRGVANPRQQPTKLTIAPREATPEEIARLEKVPWILRRGALDVVVEEAIDQETFALRLRNDITKVSEQVDQLKLIQKQLKLQEELLGADAKSKPHLKLVKGLIIKLDDLEAKFHNPKAKVSYDILAQKGGAKLYSQLSMLAAFASEGDGPPTQGMRELADELEQELSELTQLFDLAKDDDLAKVNESAKKLGVPTIWVPAKPEQKPAKP